MIFDTDTPAMICGAQRDPLAAIVQHAGTRDINTVIIGGKIVKQSGKLLDTVVNHDSSSDIRATFEEFVTDGAKVSWKQVAGKLLKSREELQKKMETAPSEPARQRFLMQVGAPADVFV